MTDINQPVKGTMENEFNLSKHERHSEIGEVYYPKCEVKEALKILKERQCVCIDNAELGIKAKCRFCKDLKQIFGDKLI